MLPGNGLQWRLVLILRSVVIGHDGSRRGTGTAAAIATVSMPLSATGCGCGGYGVVRGRRAKLGGWVAGGYGGGDCDIPAVVAYNIAAEPVVAVRRWMLTPRL